MDELARRRSLKRRRRVEVTPPPMDGTVEQVCEDLEIVTGLVTEVEAEVRAIPVVPDDLLKDVLDLKVTADAAQTTARRLMDEP